MRSRKKLALVGNYPSPLRELVSGEAVFEAESSLRALMLASLGGDAAAYRQLLADLSAHLRAYFRRRLADQGTDAEDLMQETLMAIHSRRASYDHAQPLTAWVYAMARYKLIDHLRRGRVRAALPLDACEDDLIAAGEQEQIEASRDLEQVLSELPQRQREAIRLTRVEGLSIEEAAIRTGQSATATKVGIHRGLKKLSMLWGGAPAKRSEPDAND